MSHANIDDFINKGPRTGRIKPWKRQWHFMGPEEMKEEVNVDGKIATRAEIGVLFGKMLEEMMVLNNGEVAILLETVTIAHDNGDYIVLAKDGRVYQFEHDGHSLLELSDSLAAFNDRVHWIDE